MTAFEQSKKKPPSVFLAFNSLKALLLLYEGAFLMVVLFSAAIGLSWVLIWQDSARMAERINTLYDHSYQLRETITAHINSVNNRSRLEGPVAFITLYRDHARRARTEFEQLQKTIDWDAERQMLARMKDSHTAILDRLESILNASLSDPYWLGTDSALLMSEFDALFNDFLGLLAQRRQTTHERQARWIYWLKWSSPLPLLFATGLLWLARRRVQQAVVAPMMQITADVRSTRPNRPVCMLSVDGVSEVQTVAEAINQMSSDLARSHQALLDSEKQATLGALVPVVAHNIRNPLASIRASAQMMSCDDADSAESRRGIIETVDRLGRWVSALLSYLHPLKPYKEMVAPAAVLQAAISLLQARLAERDISIVLTDCDKPVQVLMDVNLVEQAWYGLLVNAIESSPAGDTIRVTVHQSADAVTVAITDNGPGMPFTPLPQSSTVTPGPSTKRFGTGLGIPFAFKVCEAHGWQLGFGAADMGGTRVTVHIPHTDPDDQPSHY